MIQRNTATYSFRIRLKCSPTDRIQYDGNELRLPGDESVSLRSSPRELPLKDAEYLVLVGDGYDSDVAARAAGERYRGILAVALATMRVGADFGTRAAGSGATAEGIKWLEAQHGERVLNDVHGLMVYETSPAPKFFRMNANMVRGVNADSFRAAVQAVLSQSRPLTEREDLAFTLFNASFFQPTADTRFILLVMAIEALIEPEPRSVEAQAHVKEMVAQTKQAALPDAERASMVGTLRWLMKESIAQAGRRLVTARLGARIYEQKPAPQYFTYVYQMRSNLVHGNLPYPTFNDVAAAAANLELFVSDLLTSPFT